MKKLLVFRFAPGEGPGYFARFLDHLGLPYGLIRIDQNEPVPESIADASGLVMMGGPMSVNDSLPWIPGILVLVRQAMDADLPVLGHCLGGQLLSKALGGTVTANPVREIGWLPVQQLQDAAASEWLGGLAQEFEVFHWHGETFTIPEGASRILASRACANQGFVIGKALGLQCHVEMLPQMVYDWARIGKDEIARPSATVQSLEQMTENLEQRIGFLHKVADTLYSRWIQGLR